MRQASQHHFANVATADIRRSSFNRPSQHTLTMDADNLVPIYVDEILPGDTFNMTAHHFIRLNSPTIRPLMQEMTVDVHFFFVPNRLVWDNWEKFCGAQDNPGDSIDYTIPTYTYSGGNASNTIFDYFGMPLGASNVYVGWSALPARCYNLIFREWYRDQNLQDSPVVDTDNGPDNIADYVLLKRNKKHDYFTSGLPWPQKGDAVGLPLSGLAAVTGIGIAATAGAPTGSSGSTFYETSDTPGTPTSGNLYANSWNTQTDDIGIKANSTTLAAGPEIYADLSQISGNVVNINDLRLAVQTQRLLERDARSGTRYVETIMAHFGVSVPDFRVQRPEFLGGYSARVNNNVVANTAPNSDASGRFQGELGAFGTSSGSGGFTKSFTEHGILMGIASVRGPNTYQHGIERFYNKSTRYDFAYPVLATIGEQEVLNREIYYGNNPGTGATQDDGVFNYTERYNEYRYKPSRLSGLMRSNATGTLEVYHLAEEFTTRPSFGNTFIQSNLSAPLDRAIHYPSEPHFLCDFYFDLTCARPLPMYGVPGNLDHF